METKVIKKVAKSGKVSYQYYINGKLERTSSRLYVASTADGSIFWGRRDLICKGSDYSRIMQRIAWYESITREELVKSHIKDVKHYEKVLEEYKGEVHLKWLRDLKVTYRANKTISAEEEAEIQKTWKEHGEMAENWLERAKEGLANVDEELKGYREAAPKRRADMKVVYYDLTNI